MIKENWLPSSGKGMNIDDEENVNVVEQESPFMEMPANMFLKRFV